MDVLDGLCVSLRAQIEAPEDAHLDVHEVEMVKPVSRFAWATKSQRYQRTYNVVSAVQLVDMEIVDILQITSSSKVISLKILE